MSNNSVQTVNASGDKVKLILAVGAAVAGIVAFYFLGGKPMIARVGVLVAGLVVGAIIMATAETGRGFIAFAKDSIREAKKVVWPTRKEAMQVTAVVFGFVVVMAIFLWGTDKLLELFLYDLVLGWKN